MATTSQSATIRKKELGGRPVEVRLKTDYKLIISYHSDYSDRKVFE